MQPVHWTLVAMVLSLTMTEGRGQDAPRGANPAAVAEVKGGKKTEARASWWGFDPKEATRALQGAIDSGARKVVVENMGTPWIVDEITLRGDQEIVFEPGVIVQAKRGAFKGRNAALFKAVSVKNLTLRGPGATLRMWREDYDDPKQYKKAEWRNVVTLLSCANVQILGLTLAESGGDGIYLGVSRGPNTDILIQDVTCDRNYRQGISVISARGLTIERCVLKNTAGTAPMAGIDFEPNSPREEIADCVMRDCLVENNTGDGYLFALHEFDSTARPVSVRLERCRSVGNRSGVQIHAGSAAGGKPVKGELVALDCEFTGSVQSGLVVGPKPDSGCVVRFERCRVVNAAVKHPELAPILLQGGSGDLLGTGGVAFVDCTIVDPLQRKPIGYHDTAGGRKLVGVSGTLTVEHAGRRETIALDQARIDAWFPIQAFRRFPPYPGREGPYEPLAPSGSRKQWSCNVRQRGKAEWLVWAEAGAEVALTVRVQTVGKSPLQAVPVSWIGPSGKETKLGEARGTLNVSFRAVETGAQRIV
ncbi:MAG: right-handed parallel beta-helix repeat-containing protein, partial [Isosphaeraceae bacterium]